MKRDKIFLSSSGGDLCLYEGKGSADQKKDNKIRLRKIKKSLSTFGRDLSQDERWGG